MKKGGGAWEVPAPFRWYVARILASKNTILSCCSKSRYVLFLLMRYVSLLLVRFGAYSPLFIFPFLSLFSPKNYSLTLLIVGISTSILIPLIFNFFYFGSFVEVLFVLNCIIESQFIKYYII
jgi:hypothetical protein